MTTMEWVGVDVAEAMLDVHVAPAGTAAQYANDDAGIAALVAALQQGAPRLIVLEATGAYHVPLAAALGAAGLPVAIVNPRQVRDFAKATGQLAKTDRLDAAVLALFAERVRPEARPLADAETRDLQALLGRRRQLIEMLAMEKNRLHVAAPRVKKSVQALITYLEREIGKSDDTLRRLIEASPLWRGTDALLQSAPGIGPVTSAILIGRLPELATRSPRAIAKLVGLAPLNCDSGRARGQRHIRGGRADVRTALYMATLSALCCNPTIRSYYQRLRQAGKPAKVAIVAAMHKLLLLLQVLLKKQQRWHPAPAAITS